MTRYDELLDRAGERRAQQVLRIHAMDAEQVLDHNAWLEADLAEDALRLANAEQLRIANLLTVAEGESFGMQTRDKARHQALVALGLLGPER